MNKKAYELLSIYWFLILIIIAGAVVFGVLLFYSSTFDARLFEAEILTSKIGDCIVRGGVVNADFVKGDFDILKNCKINFEDSAQEFEGERQYYLQVRILDFDTSRELKKYEIGRLDFYQKCLDQKEKTEKNFPQCFEKFVYGIDEDGNKFLIKILAGVGKTEKNV